jgi:hypothetical protein
MLNKTTYDEFPIWMVAISDTVAFGIYAIGTYIMFKLGAFWGWLYLIYCLTVEFRVMRLSCIHCYYYGKLCGLGKGKLAALLFKKGEPKRFLEKKITWKDLVPDFLVSLIPFILGIYLLIVRFNLLMLALLAILLLLTTVGNGFVRGSIACKFCKQREIGCPAEKLFAGKR